MASPEESLSKFQKQQQKSLSALININGAKAGSFKATSSKIVPPSLANAKSPVKFSNNTQRLQYINSIRKAPDAAQVKRVIDLLFETRQAFTADEIKEACFVDINVKKSVFDILTNNNEKVRYDGNKFSYKAKHDVKDKHEVLVLIQKSLNGIAVADLKDSYTTVMEDLQALKASGQVWLLSSFDSKEDIAFPNDLKVGIKVDDDLKQLFRGIELPSDMLDIEKDLQKNGVKPATNTAQRRAKAEVNGIAPKPKTKKKKQREITKRTKLTNSHLPELFQNLNVPGW